VKLLRSFAVTTSTANLRAVLERHGLLAADLARMLKVTPTTVGEWVRNETPIPRRRRAQILVHLPDVTAEELGGAIPKAQHVEES
jgi:transcriptional regulator with XRE-family HTH domain